MNSRDIFPLKVGGGLGFGPLGGQFLPEWPTSLPGTTINLPWAIITADAIASLYLFLFLLTAIHIS